MHGMEPSVQAQRCNRTSAPQGSLDCFVAGLLAMTGREQGHSMIDHISVGVSDLERVRALL